MEQPEWKRARAMAKASLTILTTNYKESFGIGVVCETLREAIKVMDGWDIPKED